jgi:transposase
LIANRWTVVTVICLPQLIIKGDLEVKIKRSRKGENNIGGQEGHAGSTLTQFEEVDEIIEILIDRRTLPLGEKFKRSEPETRQVIDLNIEFLVREYQAEVLIGTDGMRFVAPFPENITKAIQYGPSVKSFAVYMSQYQLIPYARVQEVFKDKFDLKISQRSLCNFNREAFDKFEGFEADLINQLRSEKVLNADETGIKIDAQLAWAHVPLRNCTWRVPREIFVEQLSLQCAWGLPCLRDKKKGRKTISSWSLLRTLALKKLQSPGRNRLGESKIMTLKVLSKKTGRSCGRGKQQRIK